MSTSASDIQVALAIAELAGRLVSGEDHGPGARALFSQISAALQRHADGQDQTANRDLSQRYSAFVASHADFYGQVNGVGERELAQAAALLVVELNIATAEARRG